jgi:hypothetical protein
MLRAVIKWSIKKPDAEVISIASRHLGAVE